MGRDVMRWFVVQTRPNGENRAEAHLRRQGFAVFLPGYRKLRRHARRESQVFRPLFPGYLFISLDPARDGWRKILSTRGVRDLVRFGEQPAAVPPGLVEDLMEMAETGELQRRAAAPLARPGDRVRVTAGPFREWIGRLQQLADHERVVVLLDLMGRAVKVRVPDVAIQTV